MADTNINIMFKRGSQTALDRLTTAQEGCFYLTTDTNRLYVGQETGKPQLLNQTVQIKDSVSSLPKNPTENDFFYCVKENILAVYGKPEGKTSPEWIQINPDTNDNDIIKIDEVKVSDAVADASNSKLTYTGTITQNKYNKDGTKITQKDKDNKDVSVVDDVTFSFDITASDLEGIIHNPASVGLNAANGAANSNSVSVTTSGEGSNSAAAIKIKGGENIAVSAANNEITIDAQDTTYSVTKDSGLVDSDGNVIATFNAGTDLEVDVTDESITYSHAEYDEVTPSTSTAEIDDSREFTVITDVTTSNGHITGLVETTFTLPEDDHITGVTNDGEWKATIATKTNSEDYIVDFSTEASALEEKLEDSIDAKLAAVNSALTYKGTVKSYSDLALKENVEIGDVYLFSDANDNVTIDGETIDIKIGDLVIATVKDEKDINSIVGVIPSDKLKWQYVPAGNELNTDTQYHGDLTVGTDIITYTLVPSVGADEGDEAPALSSNHENLVIEAGTDLEIKSGTYSVETGKTGADGKPETVTKTKAIVNHKTITIDSDDIEEDDLVTISQSENFQAITGLTIDNGHITGYTTGTVNVDDYSLSGANDKITLTGASEAGSVSVSGDDHITVTVDNNELSIVHNDNFTNAGEETVENNNIGLEVTEISYISKITYDKAGHLLGVETDTITTPDVDYTLSTSVETDPSIVLSTSSTPEVATIQMEGSDNLVVSSSESGKINFGLVWGTFE